MKIKGPDVLNMRIKELVKSMRYIGFQATNLSLASDIIEKMYSEDATIFLSFTSNMVSSGLREIFAYIARKKLVDVIITSVGSLEEDFIKCEKPFLLGDFNADDKELHKKGINRIGNIFVPNEHYIYFEKKMKPFLSMLYEKKKIISPREIAFEMGKYCKDKNSILYWASRNNIPVFCPAITDGAFGLQVYFFKQDHTDFSIDATGDMNELAEIVYNSKNTGGIVLGGGVAKHHLIGANIVRGGLDYAVYISTSVEYDGSLSGARIKEAVSWGKVSESANSAYVEGDATILFPLLAACIVDRTRRKI